MTALPLIETVPAAAYETELFGTLHVDDSQLVHFDEGLLGFPAFRRWILLEGARRGTAWLQSAEHRSLAFLVVEPFVVFDEFTLDISDADVARLGASHAEQLTPFALVTLPRPGETATANLQGPLLINLESRRAAQIIISESAWGVRQPLPADLLRTDR